jgi:hypothetical protein
MQDAKLKSQEQNSNLLSTSYKEIKKVKQPKATGSVSDNIYKPKSIFISFKGNSEVGNIQSDIERGKILSSCQIPANNFQFKF